MHVLCLRWSQYRGRHSTALERVQIVILLLVVLIVDRLLELVRLVRRHYFISTAVHVCRQDQGVFEHAAVGADQFLFLALIGEGIADASFMLDIVSSIGAS